MPLLRSASFFMLVVAGCSVSSAPYYNFGSDAGGGGGGGDAGHPADLATLFPSDMSIKGPVDLALPMPDLARRPPDLSVVCAAGRYAGPVMANATVLNVPTTLTGTVTLQLGPSQNGVLPIIAGMMSGSTQQQGGTATANVTGELDCNSLTLVNGKLTNGKATIPMLGFSLPFTGTIDGSYDPAQQAFVNGTLTAMGTSFTGNGTWEASYLGP